MRVESQEAIGSGEWGVGSLEFPIPHSAFPTSAAGPPLNSPYETPPYLRGVAGLSAELAAVAEASDTRRLTRNERRRLRRGIDAAAARVRAAREARVEGRELRGESQNSSPQPLTLNPQP